MENIELIDATLFFANGWWWLMGTTSLHPVPSTNDQLLLFYSKEPFSQSWTPHPQNPVATNIGNCRPAGNIFTVNGKFFRPAQNNASRQYGYGIKINEIEVLTTTDYREKEVLAINPKQWGLKACHTLNFSASMVVIDGIK